MSRQKEQRQYDITVTEEDIANAVKNSSSHCVVADAIRRQVPDVTHVEVDLQTVRFSRQGKRYTFLTPYGVQGYVIAFDAGDQIDPFGFRLRSPARVARSKMTPKGQVIRPLKARVARAERKIAAQRELGLAVSDDLIAKRETARRQLVEAKSKAEAGPDIRMEKGVRRAPPQTWRTGQRKFGMRLLRVNKLEQEAVG